MFLISLDISKKVGLEMTQNIMSESKNLLKEKFTVLTKY